MQNDMLKNNIAPWQEKGRWYHGKIDLATKTFMQDECDSYIIDNFILQSASQNYYIGADVGKGYIMPISLQCVYHNVNSAATYFANNMYMTAGGIVRLGIFPVGINSGTLEFWIFIVEV